MLKVAVVFASRHGGTAGIADRIEDVLTGAGLDVALVDLGSEARVGTFDAYVIGSGVYIGRWLDAAVDFLQKNAEMLASKPVWLFSSGPLGVIPHDANQLEAALGPADGPGSSGRRRIAQLSEVIKPRGHHVFSGVFDPTDPPKSLQERIVRMLPAARATLPAADFRDWVEIEDWAHMIARELLAVVDVGHSDIIASASA